MSTATAGSLRLGLPPARSSQQARVVVRGIRVTATLALWLAFGVLAGVAAVIAAPKFFGGQALTVMSGSMAPAIDAGDIVLTERIRPLDARVGDVVTFRSHERGNRLLTHRVREITVKGDEVTFVTKGDAVNASEEWTVPMSATLARPKFRLRTLGYALFWLAHPLGRLALYVLPALLIGGYVLISIWRPKPVEKRAAADRPLVLAEPKIAEAEDLAVEETSAVEEAVAVPTNERPRVEATFPHRTAFVIVGALALLAFALFRMLRPILGGLR